MGSKICTAKQPAPTIHQAGLGYGSTWNWDYSHPDKVVTELSGDYEDYLIRCPHCKQKYYEDGPDG